MNALIFLLWRLVPLRMVAGTVPGYASDVWTVASEEAPIYTRREFAGFHTALLWGLWCGRESGGQANVVSPDGQDCGVCGMRIMTLTKLGSSCNAVRLDRKLGLRLGLQWMRLLKSQCDVLPGVTPEHAVECALRAYASGSFTKAYGLVKSRCAYLGPLGCTDNP